MQQPETEAQAAEATGLRVGITERGQVSLTLTSEGQGTSLKADLSPDTLVAVISQVLDGTFVPHSQLPEIEVDELGWLRTQYGEFAARTWDDPATLRRSVLRDMAALKWVVEQHSNAA